jgi:hypothetical protein
MGVVQYQVSVTVSGVRKGTILADDPTTAQDAIALFAQRFGAAAPAMPTPAQQIQTAFARTTEPDRHTPICAIHQLPMNLMHGKRGTFWSCHEKNSGGSWCTFKPSVSQYPD